MQSTGLECGMKHAQEVKHSGPEKPAIPKIQHKYRRTTIGMVAAALIDKFNNHASISSTYPKLGLISEGHHGATADVDDDVVVATTERW